MSRKNLNQYYKKAFQDFAGGLNTQDSPLTTQPNQFKQLDNWVVNDRGLLEKVEGYSIDGSPFPDDADSFIRMLVNYKRGTSVDKLVCSALDEGNSNATYRVDLKETAGDGNYAYIGHTTGTATFNNANTALVGVGTAWASHLKAGDKIKAASHTDAMYTEISSVTNDTNIVLVGGGYLGANTGGVAFIARIILHEDFIPSGITFNDNLVITNGSEAPMSYNNTTLNKITDTDAPKGKFIEAHKSRIFIAHTTGSPSSVYWSATNDETAWDATSVEPIFPKDGGNICGIKSFADSLIVFKDNGKICQVVGDFDQSTAGEPNFIRKVDTPDNIGVIAGYTAVIGNDNRLYFLAESGVYALDRGMGLRKMSWNINPTTSSITMRSGTVSAKAFTYDTKTQWDGGTYSGTMATSTGELRPYVDKYAISDALKGNRLVSVAIDSSQTVHVAYVSSIVSRQINYKKYTSDGTLTSETAFTLDASGYGGYNYSAVSSISIDVAANGDVGIVVGAIYGDSGAGWIAALVGGYRTSGAWGSKTEIQNLGLNSNLSVTPYSVSVATKFRSDNLQRMFSLFSDSGGTTRDQYWARTSGSGGTWSVAGTVTSSVALPIVGYCDLALNSSDNPRIAFVQGTTSNAIENTYSNNDGSSWTTANFTTSITSVATGPFVQVTSGGNFRFVWGGVYSGSDQIVRRDVTAGTSTVIDSSSAQVLGYALNSSNEDTTYEVTTSTSGTEKVYYNQSTTFTASSSYLGTTLYQNGARGMAINSNVYATVGFGVNANEVVVRRTSFSSNWKSNEASDATLTAWSVATIVATVNSVTTTYTAALATSDQGADPLADGAYTTTLVSGNVVSTDSTKVFQSTRVTFVLTDFVGASVESIILDYTGTGAGPVLPTGILFDNEVYFSYSASENNNSHVLLLDKEGSFVNIDYPVIFMARYKGLLYAGMATTGKVAKLRDTFAFNTASYTATAISKEDLLGSLELEKDIHKIYLIYETKLAGTFTFSYRLDNFKNPAGATWKDTTVTQTSASATPGFAEILVGNKATSVQFKVSNASASNEVAVIGWVIRYDYLNVR